MEPLLVVEMNWPRGGSPGLGVTFMLISASVDVTSKSKSMSCRVVKNERGHSTKHTQGSHRTTTLVSLFLCVTNKIRWACWGALARPSLVLGLGDFRCVIFHALLRRGGFDSRRGPLGRAGRRERRRMGITCRKKRLGKSVHGMYVLLKYLYSVTTLTCLLIFRLAESH
jgi:hypothetical protein